MITLLLGVLAGLYLGWKMAEIEEGDASWLEGLVPVLLFAAVFFIHGAEWVLESLGLM